MMDPEATLKALKDSIDDGEYHNAVLALRNYYVWRLNGGFQPINGDTRAAGLTDELADAVETSCDPAVDNAN